jgi:hypothetical protein
MQFKNTITASELKRGMNFAIPNHFLKFTDRKLDSQYHTDTVDGIVETCDENGNDCLAIFGYDKIVYLPYSQYVFLL